MATKLDRRPIKNKKVKSIFLFLFQHRIAVYKKGTNMQRLSLSTSILVFCLFPLIVCASGNWYGNGTLHRASVAEWNKATYANRLATAADWSISRPQIKAKVKNSGSMDTLKPFAVELVSCINEAAAGKDYGNMSATEIAAGCMILMGW
jgi:hypothetical protein